MSHKSVLLLIIIIFVNAAAADTVEYDLSCDGYYWLGNTWTQNFDLGVTFSDISSIEICLAGSITAVEFEPVVPLSIYDRYSDGRFNTSIRDFGSSTALASKSVSAGLDTAPSPEPFNLQSLFSISDYSPFLDGTGSININLSQTYPLLWYSGLLEVVSNASGQIDSAKLVFEGTVVPEPAALLLFGLGALHLLRKQK